MSILGKKWVFRDGAEQGLVLPDLDDDSVRFNDPWTFRDMEKAVDRLTRALENQERIIVFGDYDVDGISGTALLVKTLRELDALVSYRLPDRQTGYGLQSQTIEECQTLGVRVLVTVDCGISNAEEIAAAKAAGIDVIVTDHHTLPERLPEAAVALIHPALPGQAYPFHELAGSAVAFKLAVALMQRLRGEAAATVWTQKIVDLASLGTVADCMPLRGENRWITKHGLDQMKVTEWEGLRALLKVAGVESIRGHDSEVIGFRIGPRLNAAGRLESPYYALQLLLNENEKAWPLAQKLEELNQARRDLMDQCLNEAEAQLKAQGEALPKIIVVGSSDWPAGIIGLIAGRLTEKYHRPTIVFEDRGDSSVASCRSVPGISIVDALTQGKAHLKTFGGHAAAAGFTILNTEWEPFLRKIKEYGEAFIQTAQLQPTLMIEGTLHPDEVNASLVERLETQAPFGEGNPKPRFLIEAAHLGILQRVGQTHKHLKLELKQKKGALGGIAFHWGEHYERFEAAAREGRSIQAVVEVTQREWQGRSRIELQWIDARL